MAGHLFAALLIAQNVRWKPKDRFYRRPIDCLPSIKEKIDKALSKLKIVSPNQDEISIALMEYHMLKEEEMTAWKEMLVQN